MKKLSESIEIFFTNEEYDNGKVREERIKLEEEGYEYTEGYNTRLDDINGFVIKFDKRL